MKPAMPVALEPVENYIGLDERGAENYYKALSRKGLAETVTKSFECRLKDCTGFSDEHLPESDTEIEYNLGDISFRMLCSPTRKRPSYEAVFSDLKNYLEELRTGYENGIRRKGVLSIDGRPYVELSDITDRINMKRGEVTREGVKIGISEKTVPSGLFDDLYKVTIPLDFQDSQLTEGAARLYLKAEWLVNGYRAVINGFEKALIGLTGYGMENIPEETTHFWESFGRHLFHVPVIPYPSTSYGKVMKRLVGEGKTAKTTGDLVLIRNNADNSRLSKYAVRIRDGRHFVSLDGIMERITEIRDSETGMKVRQKPIEHYPLV